MSMSFTPSLKLRDMNSVFGMLFFLLVSFHQHGFNSVQVPQLEHAEALAATWLLLKRMWSCLRRF